MLPITDNGKRQKVTKLEAILRRLAIKELAGDDRAARVRLKYTRYIARGAKRRSQLVFVDSEYTKAIASPLPNGANDER
jgi:hypothetical protein